MATSMKVVLPSDQSAIPVTLTSTTITGNVSENLAQVNGVTVLTGTGATGTGSQRVTVAVDSATVGGSASLPAGVNNIGDVDVLTLPVAFNTGVRSATTQRVTVATDDLVPISAASLPLPALAATSTKQSDGSQKTQLVDGAGVVIGPAVVSAGNNLPVALGATNYVLSTANTTTSQLAVGATFTGTVENTFNQQSYSILLTSDQDGTLTLKQYTDAAGLVVNSTSVIDVKAGIPVAQSNVVNGNYFNLTFKNIGSATTTTLNINTAYGTIPATTQLNNAPVSINEIGGTALTAGQKTGAKSIPVVLPSDMMGQVEDQGVKDILYELLMEVRAKNVQDGVSPSDTNKYRVRNANGLEVVGIANTRDRIRTAQLTLSASTTETTLIPGDSNVYNDLLAIIVINTSTATNSRVDIRDDTGGAVKIPLMSIGGSPPVGFSLGGVAIPQTTRGANWTAQCATATTDIRLLAIYSIN